MFTGVSLAFLQPCSLVVLGGFDYLADACEKCVIGGYLTHPPWLTLWAKFWDFGLDLSLWLVSSERPVLHWMVNSAVILASLVPRFADRPFSRNLHYDAIMWHRPDTKELLSPVRSVTYFALGNC